MGVNCPPGLSSWEDGSGSAPRYGYTDNFGKNYVYQVGCYGKRGQLRVHVFYLELAFKSSVDLV